MYRGVLGSSAEMDQGLENEVLGLGSGHGYSRDPLAKEV